MTEKGMSLKVILLTELFHYKELVVGSNVFCRSCSIPDDNDRTTCTRCADYERRKAARYLNRISGKGYEKPVVFRFIKEI
jgi:hypothetical protein